MKITITQINQLIKDLDAGLQVLNNESLPIRNTNITNPSELLGNTP